MRFSNSNVLPTSFDCNEYPSDSGRNLIGRRTQSDRAANGNRSGGGRNPIGWRVPSRGCTCLKCTNKASKNCTNKIRGVSILLGWCT